MKTEFLTTLTIIGATSVMGLSAGSQPTHAATITASYDRGYLDVLINGYGTDGLGTFHLANGDTTAVALCIEADQPHSTQQDAYAPVSSTFSAPRLDALIWILERSAVDDDMAIAAAALAWYYADAQRDIGASVWADGTRNFAPIGPLAPEAWDQLAPFGLHHPIGLRAEGADLEVAERRVAELHRRVEAIEGPWELAPDEDSSGFVLRGAAGPIPGQLLTIVISPIGATPTTTEAMTDAGGHVAVELSGHDRGATIRATTDAPGPRQEWDGPGGVQRMITATTVSLQTELVIAPHPHHVRVVKRSTDPTIGVAGGVFAVYDAAGSEIARATSDADGSADFAPIDPARHPPPYSVVELAAPPALRRSGIEHPIADASTDPNEPTIVVFDNHPATVEVVIEKRLSNPAAGGSDRGDFVFEIVRTQDDSTTRVITGADGTTTPVDLAVGSYEICETDVPEWATSLIDSGCTDVEIGLEQLTAGERLSVPYLNVVPPPGIDTTAHDAADGDQTLTVDGGVVIDEVWLTGLVPGSAYTIIAELVSIADGGTTTVIDHVEAAFLAEFELAMVPIQFDVPPLDPTTLVVVDTLMLGDELVAVHDDLGDLDQTVTVIAPAPTTTTTSTTTTSTTTSTTTIAASTTTSTSVVAPTEATPTTAVVVTTSSPADPTPVVTLPRTGNDATRQLLRIGDLGFVAGIALIALAGLLPRRAMRTGDAIG